MSNFGPIRDVPPVEPGLSIFLRQIKSAVESLISNQSSLQANVSLVKRNDPTSVDFSNLITDQTWRDLDLGGIVPEGAIAVVIYVALLDDAAGNGIWFKKKGDSGARCYVGLRSQVANIYNEATFVVFCDENRVIQYYGTNTTFTAIEVVVTGWFV